MKNNLVRAIPSLVISFCWLMSCNNAGSNVSDDLRRGLFPAGKQGPPANFTGKAYNISLVETDSIYNTVVGNVYFEAGARSNWHSHPGGQILIITAGEGYHQIMGGPRQTLHKGDVVKCPPGTLHWHGGSSSSGMQQIYIVSNTELGIVDWKQAVTDREYNGN